MNKKDPNAVLNIKAKNRLSAKNDEIEKIPKKAIVIVKIEYCSIVML